jgi:hypothetical protein
VTLFLASDSGREMSEPSKIQRRTILLLVGGILLGVGGLVFIVGKVLTRRPVEVSEANLQPSNHVMLPEMTLEIRQPDRDEVVRVHLNPERIRKLGLSRDDVAKAFVESGVVGPGKRAEPPPGVVFVSHLLRPDQYRRLILKATPEGDVVRIEDVATVEER